MGRFLSTGQVGRLCGVSPVTVAKWIDQGVLRGHVTPGGHRRVTVGDLIRFLEQHRMYVPPELETDVVRRILVADPDDRFRDSLRIAVEAVSPKFEFCGVASGTQALVLVGSWRPHIVMLGLGLEDIDPLEVCRWLSDIPESAATALIVVTRELDEHTTMDEDARIPVVLVPRSKVLANPVSFLKQLAQMSDEGSLVSHGGDARVSAVPEAS